MTITFSGLSSGIDSTSLISQLVAAEKQPETTLRGDQNNLASQKQSVDLLASAVAGFGDFADSMSLSAATQFRTATTSDSHVTVAVSGAAAATAHTVRVEQTARAQVVSSRTFATSAAGVLGDGAVTFQTATGTPATVVWSAADSLADIAAKITGSKAGVTASVLYDGSTYRLMVHSAQPGVANAATFTDAGDSLGLSDPANVKATALDAKALIDGVEVTRPTNVIDDALTGVTITAVSAQGATDPDTQVGVSLDTTAAGAKLNTLVNTYNSVMTKINDQLTYTGTTKGADTLFGDSTLQQLQGAMTSLITQGFGGNTLDGLGISIDKTGVMSLDSTKLGTALAAKPNALDDLFVAGGLSGALRDLDNTYTRAGDGVLTVKSQGMTDRSTDLQKEIDQIDSNATALQTRLQAQFTALEATMSQFQSQASYISKIL